MYVQYDVCSEVNERFDVGGKRKVKEWMVQLTHEGGKSKKTEYVAGVKDCILPTEESA
jgi:hypothetical protein